MSLSEYWLKKGIVVEDILVCTCSRGEYLKETIEVNGSAVRTSGNVKWPKHLDYGSPKWRGCSTCGGYGWVGRKATLVDGTEVWLSNHLIGSTMYEGKPIKSMCGKNLIINSAFDLVLEK